MFKKIKEILKDERGMETAEVIGYALIALVFTAVIYNGAKTQIDTATNSVGAGIDSLDKLQPTDNAINWH